MKWKTSSKNQYIFENVKNAIIKEYKIIQYFKKSKYNYDNIVLLEKGSCLFITVPQQSKDKGTKNYNFCLLIMETYVRTNKSKHCSLLAIMYEKRWS